MKDSFRHIFSKDTATLINDLKHHFNRTCIIVCILLWFSTPFVTSAQHIDNGRRADSLLNKKSSSFSTLRTSATVYNVTGGGSYCSGGAGIVVGLDGSETGV